MAQTTTNTVVGVFRDEPAARKVMGELENAGIPRDRMHLGSGSDWTSEAARGGAGLSGEAPHHHGGFIGWLESLFGSDSGEHRDNYAEAVRRGNCVLAVDADASDSDRIVDIMERYDAVDIDREVENYRQTGYTGFDPSSRPYTDAEVANERNASGARSIPVVQEELQVGKRAVQRGGVRVFTRTTEQPVEEQVTLRDEKVRVDRRPVNQPVNPGDPNILRDQTIEVMETSEEPVVSKVARVVEEVAVGKEATEHTETVRDTVRRQQVEVEQVGAQSGRADIASGDATYADDFRRDYQSRYASSGADYNTYAPAYQYGYRMANDPRYRGRSFDDVEETMKTDYLRNNPNSSWDRVRGAVRYGWERVSGKR